MAGPGGIINLTSGDDLFPFFGDDNSGNETINGLGGNDTIFGGAGIDTLNGGDGNDILQGEEIGTGLPIDSDTYNGGIGNDTIRDVVGNTVTIDGGAGDDRIELFYNGIFKGYSSGTIDGGAGTDTLASPLDQTISLYQLTISNVEIFEVGLAGSIPATISMPAINGFASQFDAFDDIVQSAINPGHAVLQLRATGLPVTLDLSDELNNAGGTTSVTVTGSFDNETITGGDGNDTLKGGGGIDTLNGGAGNDNLDGGGGTVADTLNGGAGNDILRAYDNDIVNAGSGNDFVNNSVSTGGTLDGGSGTDELFATNLGSISFSNFEILRTEGNGITGTAADFETFDSIFDSPGQLLLPITLFLEQTGAPQILDLADKLINGGNSRRAIVNLSDDDTTIAGGPLADNIRGGSGSNTINYQNSNAAVNVDLNITTAPAGSGGHADGDFLFQIGSIIGSDFDDILTAGPGGGTLTGRLGNDTLNGSTGDDTLIGLGGADIHAGGGGTDTADYSTSLGTLDINLLLNTSTGGQDTTGDTFSSVENVIGTGNWDYIAGDFGSNRFDGGDGNDTLMGRGGRDVLFGEADNDRVFGGEGNDFLFGGEGDDMLYGGGGGDAMDGGNGTDTVNFASVGSQVTMNLLLGTIFGRDAAGDTFISIERFIGSANQDYLAGDNGDNWFDGAAGNDTLMGRLGADTLRGGLGNDRLFGGFDTDIFQMEDNFGNDMIFDLENGIEIVDVSAVTGASAATLTTSIGGSGNVFATFDGGINTIEFIGITNVADITDTDFMFV